MTFAEKLLALDEAKKNALIAINAKGVYVPTTFPFRRYGEKIMEIAQTVSGDRVGAVNAPPSGTYQQQVEVWLTNGFLDQPRFYTSSNIFGLYEEVLSQPLMLTEDAELYVFASDKKGEVLTSIYHFSYKVSHEGMIFTDTGVLASALLLGGSDIALIVFNKILQTSISETDCQLTSVDVIEGTDRVNIIRTSA